MKYLLLIISVFLLVGCNKKNKQNNETQSFQKKIETNNTVIKKHSNFTIKIEDTNLSFKNDKLIYPNKKMVLLFYDKNLYSQEQMKILNKLNIKYYKTDNEFLKKYFNIMYYPTIVILDKNKTIKFENFTPYEILKTEGF